MGVKMLSFPKEKDQTLIYYTNSLRASQYEIVLAQASHS